MAHLPPRIHYRSRFDGVPIGTPVFHRISEIKTTKILMVPDDPLSDTVYQTKSNLREVATTTSHLQPLPLDPADRAAHGDAIPANFPFTFVHPLQLPLQNPPIQPVPNNPPPPAQPAQGNQARRRPPGHRRNAAHDFFRIIRNHRARSAPTRVYARNGGTSEDPIIVDDNDADDEQ